VYKFSGNAAPFCEKIDKNGRRKLYEIFATLFCKKCIMQLTIIDPHVSDTMNVFLVLANIINVVYNIPQMMRTYETKSTKDFSTWFIFLRIIGNSIWISYSININSLQMLINNCVTVSASLFISYYKCREIYADYNEKKQLHGDDTYKLLDKYTAVSDDDTLLENGVTDEPLKEMDEQFKRTDEDIA
jgi:MtN3 and saliva related transmembrane protein